MIPGETFAECVGGPADGVQLTPDDPSEPDDWPDYLEISCPKNVVGAYWLRDGNPVRKGPNRVYLYDYEAARPTEG